MRGVAKRLARRAGRRRARLPLAVLAILTGTAALTAAPAMAQEVHVLTQTIAGNFEEALNAPRAIAIDNSGGASAGDVYVADTRNQRVEKFSPSGEFLLMFGKGVNEGTGDPNVCTNVGPPTDECKAKGESGYRLPTAFQNAFSIAVDPSASPSAGDVYVADIGISVQKFDPSGNLITSWGGSPFPGAEEGFGGSYWPLAVDGSGDLFVLGGTKLTKLAQDGTSLGTVTSPLRAANGLALTGTGSFFQINNTGSLEEIGSTGTDLGRVNQGSAPTTAIAFDAAHGELFTVSGSYSETKNVNRYVINGLGEVVEPDSSTCAPNPSGCAPTETFGNEDFGTSNEAPQGIALNTASRKVYVADTAANDVKVYSFLNLPKVTTGSTEDLERTSVKLLGHVDPDGAGEVSSCEFEYGLSKEYELGSATCTPPSTTAATDVSAELPAGSLEPETTYHYRLVAGNAEGNRPAADQTFTTPPAVGGVATAPASEVGRLEATLNGSFSGDGVDTSYYFEYGPTESYGEKTPDIDQGTATGTQQVSATVSGLFAYYPYHYRLVAHNQYGQTVGADQTFQTLAPQVPSVRRTFASRVDQSSATIEAEIDPGEGLTVYRFEYGPTVAYGSRTLVAGPIDPNAANRIASAELSGLSPGATYHFRVLATNFTGTAVGPDQTFTTPSAPVIASTSASAVTQTSAVLGGLVNPGLSLTTYYFEYGPSAAYGSRTPVSAPVGPDNAVHAVAATLTGLAPGTTYHFRLIAGNGVGTAASLDQTFKTASQSAPKHHHKPKKCKRGFVRKHGKCVRKRHVKHHRKHHRRKGHRRG